MQPPTVREVIRRLKSEGWVLDHTTGDHRIFRRDGKVIPVAGKESDHLDRGTYGSIRRRAGW